MQKSSYKLIIGIFFLFFVIPTADAVGLSAYQLVHEFDYQSGLVKTFPYQLEVTNNQVMDYKPFAKGDLAPYVKFIPEVLPQVGPGQRPWFNVVISLPKDKTDIEPGRHRVLIGVAEQNPGGFIGATTSVLVPIYIRVLYEEATLRASMTAHDTGINDPAPVDIRLSNWGEEKISSAQATIFIIDKNNETLDTITTDKVSVPSAGSKTLHTLVHTLGYPPGLYTAKATIDWDKGQDLVEDEFRVGIEDVKITGYTTRFNAGVINAFHVDIESVWNNNLPGVIAAIDINSEELRTPTTGLAAFQEKRLSTFWDLSQVEAGNYDGEITLFYSGNSKKKSIRVSVIDEDSELSQPDVQSTTSTSSPILTLIILIIILNLVVWIYLFIKRRREDDEEDED